MAVSIFLRRVALLVAICAGLLLLVLGAAHLPGVRARVLAYATHYAARELGIAVRAASLDFSLFGRWAELRDVTLASIDDQGQRPFLRADGVRVGLGRSLFRGRLDVTGVALVRPRFTIVRYADGRLNLPVGRDAGSAQPAPVHLGRVEVQQLLLAMDDEASGHAFALGPVDLAVDTSATGAAPGAFGPSPFTLRLDSDAARRPATTTAGRPNPDTLSGTVTGRLAFDGTRLQVRALSMETPEGRLAIDGSMDVIAAAPRVDARAQLTLDLARAARLAGRDDERLSGALRATATARGLLASPAMQVSLSGRGLSVRSFDDIALAAEATIGDGRVTVSTIDLRSPLGALQAKGEAALSGAGGGSSWVTRVEAQASTTLRAEAAGLSLNGEADLRVGNGAWSIEHRLRSPTSGASLAGTLRGAIDPKTSGSTLGGRSRLRIPDLATVVPLLRDAGVAIPEPLATGVSGTLDAAIDLRGTIAQPVVQAGLKARDLRAQVLPSGRTGTLDSSLTATLDSLRVQTLEAQVGPTRLEASGSYTWSGRADVRFDVDAGDLSALARIVDVSTVPVSGSAHLAGRAWGTVHDPQAEATLNGRDVSVDGVAVGPLEATLALAKTRLRFEATAPSLSVAAQGTLDTLEPYRFQAQARLERTALPPLVPARLRDQVPVSDGVATGTVSAGGTLSPLAVASAEADLDAFEGVVSGTRVVLETPATLAWTPSRLAVGGLALRAGQEIRARISGTLADTPGAEPLRITAASPLAELIALAGPILPEGVTLAADGRVAADLGIGGTLAAPSPSGTITLRAASVAYGDLPPATGVAIDARIEPARIVVPSLAATWQQAALSGSGAIPLRLLARALAGSTDPPAGAGTASTRLTAWLDSLPEEPRTASVSARVVGITKEVLTSVASVETLREVEGRMALTLTADAEALTLEGMNASAVIDEAAITLAGVPFTQTVPTRLRLERGRATIDALRWDSLGNPIVVSGSANLAAPTPTVEARVDGTLDLRVAGAFAGDIDTAGTARVSLAVGGLLASPAITGEIVVADGELRVDRPRLVVSEMAGTVRLAADRSATMGMTGTLNGGRATVEGTLDLSQPATPRGIVALTAQSVAFEYPDGFQTESNASLTLTLASAAPMLAGRIDVLGGTYRDPIVITGQLVEGLRQSGIATTAEPSAFLSTLRLDIALATADALRLDNNYARLDLTGVLRVSGTADRPGAVGRLEASPDGEVYLAGNTYRIERLVVDFANPRAIVPELSFLGDTRAGDMAVEVELTCSSAGPCERQVRSLTTGQTDEDAEARLFGVPTDATAAGQQLARLLSGEVLGLVSRGVGLDMLRLEQGALIGADIFDDPTLVSGDIDPASRLTLGKRLGDRVTVAYSQDLSAGGFTWITSYAGPFGLSARALLFDDQSRSYELRHEPRFGGSRRARQTRPVEPRVAEVRIGGNPGFPEQDLRRQLRLTPGDRFQFRAWQRDRDRLAALYRSRGFHEARIRARRNQWGQVSETAPAPMPAAGRGQVSKPAAVPAKAGAGAAEPDAVVLEYLIERGPQTILDVRGTALPDDVRDRILERWSSAVFDGFLERDARTIVRDHLSRNGYLDATVDATIVRDAASGATTLTIEVQPGARVARELQFAGNQRIPTARLQQAAQATGTLAAWIDPAAFARLIERICRDDGFLSARVDVAPPAIAGGTSTVRVTVREGPPFLVGTVGMKSGEVGPDHGLSENDLREALGISPEMPYQPRALADALGRVDARLRQAGFLAARSSVTTVVRQDDARVDVQVVVDAGPRSMLRDVVVEGSAARSPLVARAIALTPGAPIDPASLADTRQRLYDTGLYRGVEIDLQPVQGPASPGAADAGTQPVDARIRLFERPRVRFRYGLAFSDEVGAEDTRDRTLGFAADLEHRNLFGVGANAGVSARLRQDQQVGRLFVGASRFFGLPLRSSVFIGRSRDTLKAEETYSAVATVTSLSIEQMYSIRRRVELRYGYAIERNRTFIQTEVPFDVTVRVARLTASGLIDRRNDPFDPARGWFVSSSVELSRPSIGSVISFLRSFTQVLHFKPVGRGMVLASGARLGLARTFAGEVLILTERFYAGGAVSVRGYREGDLGPRSILGDADGGQAMLVLNEELRFPIYRWVRGVGFVDLGNVYPTAGELSLGDLQIGIGAGVRLDTPVGLLRLDLGVPANRREIDPKWKLYFGLGHTF